MSYEFKQQEVKSCLDQSVHSSLSGNSEVKHEDGIQVPGGAEPDERERDGTKVPGGAEPDERKRDGTQEPEGNGTQEPGRGRDD